MGHSEFDPAAQERRPWNAGRMVGAKRALKPRQVWAIRFWLDSERRFSDRAMFDLAIDSKLRGCDIVRMRIGDLVSGGRVRTRAAVTQQKTGRPVQFELLEAARAGIQAWLERRRGGPRRLRLPESNPPRPAHQHPAVCPPGRRVGHWHWPTPGGLRHAFAPADEGVDHLQGHRQPACRPAPAGPHQDRKHGAVLGGGRRGCAQPCRAHRGMRIGPASAISRGRPPTQAGCRSVDRIIPEADIRRGQVPVAPLPVLVIETLRHHRPKMTPDMSRCAAMR